MSLIRIVSFVVAFVISLFIFFVYQKLSYLGFRDGHLTDFERATKLPFTIWNWFNFVFCLLLFYFLLNPSKMETLKKFLYLILFIIFFSVCVFWGIFYYFRIYLHLENGEGGQIHSQRVIAHTCIRRFYKFPFSGFQGRCLVGQKGLGPENEVKHMNHYFVFILTTVP